VTVKRPHGPVRIVDHEFVTSQRRSGYGDVEKHMYFDELSNDEWALLRPLVSNDGANRQSRRGRPRTEPRVVVNAVLWVMTTGEPWSRLPCGYPSGPTCRCRFEEWRSNGTLLAMVTLLSKNGRTFAYIPTGSSPDMGHALPHAPRFLRDDGAPQVLWQNADAWQSSLGEADKTLETTPFSEIARQLSGRQGHQHRALPAEPERVSRSQRPERTEYTPWMGLHSRGKEVADARGYVMYVAADRLEEASFRGWAEVVKNGRRVARSGLIGPRFDNAAVAQQYALDWASRWIDQHCPAPVVTEVAKPSPQLNAIPPSQPVAQATTTLDQDEFSHESVRW
jgi:transposase